MVWNATVVNEALRMSLDSGFGRINMHMKENIISRIHISSGIKSSVICTEEMIQCSQHTTSHWLVKSRCTSISRAQCWSLIFGDLPVTQHQMWPCEAWGVEVSTAVSMLNPVAPTWTLCSWAHCKLTMYMGTRLMSHRIDHCNNLISEFNSSELTFDEHLYWY